MQCITMWLGSLASRDELGFLCKEGKLRYHPGGVYLLRRSDPIGDENLCRLETILESLYLKIKEDIIQ